MNKKPAEETKEFHGRTAEMRDSPWLSSEDLIGMPPQKLTIEGVYFHKNAEFEDGRKKDSFAVKFVGKSRQLILNATNRKTLFAMYGEKVDDWKGKDVVLAVVKLSRPCNGKTHGIRIQLKD